MTTKFNTKQVNKEIGNIVNSDMCNYTIIGLLILYAVILLPNLDISQLMVLDNLIFRLFIVILIVLICVYDPIKALLMAICLVLSVQRLQKLKNSNNQNSIQQNNQNNNQN